MFKSRPNKPSYTGINRLCVKTEFSFETKKLVFRIISIPSTKKKIFFCVRKINIVHLKFIL